MHETLPFTVESTEDSQGVNQDPAVGNALILLWSRDEPERSGELALLPAGYAGMNATLGRAEPEGDPSRLELVRQRPGEVHPNGALRSPRISREQLLIRALKGGRMRVENVGRAPLMHNGNVVQDCEIKPGDRLEIQKQALFLVAHRPLTLPRFPVGTAAPPPFAFGGPDTWGVVGESPVAWGLRERVSFVAGRAAHVLIRGASGTGKELVAQAIHRLSPRARGPLVTRNAATIPETLIDAELFGNARNYPNPGMPDRPGLIGEADGGTLFLDEFAEIPPAMQAHLLRVLDQGEYHRLGEARTRKADFRLIAATNRPESALKEDVLARLRIRVEVPDLNARREDIPLLTVHLLRRIGKSDPELAARYFPDGNLRQFPRVSMALMSALVARNYTTNVRELESVLWGAMAEGRSDTLDVYDGLFQTADAVEAEDLGDAPEGPFVDPLTLTPDDIQTCLDKHQGRQEPVWRELGLSSRHVLTRLVKRYGLNVRGRAP